MKTADVGNASLFETSMAGESLAHAATGRNVEPNVPSSATTKGTHLRVLRRVVRVTRDIVLGLALIAAIPLSFLRISEQRGWNMTEAGWRRRYADHLRSLMAPVDASITPEAAGAAMRRLLPVSSSNQVAKWSPALPPGLFVGDIDSSIWNGPGPFRLIKEAGKGVWSYKKLGISEPSGLRFTLSDGFGISQAEHDWLKALAELPVWKDLDLVAAATRVDMAGPRVQLLFNAQLLRSRGLSWAGSARAAYYVSIGDRARAEAALRSLVSFGFALLDNGITTSDATIGRDIVHVGRAGLMQLYMLDGRSNLLEMTDAQPFVPPRSGSQPPDRSAAGVRAEAIRNVTDPSLPRSVRFEQLSAMAWSTCRDVRSLLLPPSEEVQHAFDVARETLAQTDAERRYVDLLERNATTMPFRPAPPSLVLQVVQSAAVVTSMVTSNPRIARCTGAVIADLQPR